MHSAVQCSKEFVEDFKGVEPQVGREVLDRYLGSTGNESTYRGDCQAERREHQSKHEELTPRI